MLGAGLLLTFLGSVALMSGAIMRSAKTFKEMAGAVRLLYTITKALTIATWEQTVAALSNPYVLIAIAVVALVVAMVELYKHSERFRAIMDAIGRGIKTGFMATVRWFEGLPKFFEQMWTDISKWFAVGVTWVKKNWDILLALMTGPLGLMVLIWRRFGGDIVNFFKAIPGAVTGFVTQAISAALVFVQKLPYYIGYALGFTLGIVTRMCFDMGKAIYNFASTAVTDTVTFFAQLPGRLMAFFTRMLTDFTKWSIQFGVGVKNWAINAFNTTVSWFTKLPGRVYQAFVSLWHSSTGAWNVFSISLHNWLINTYNSVVNWFGKLPGRVYSLLIDLKNKAWSAFTTLVSDASNFGSSLYNGFMSFINQIPGAVTGAINNAISAFNGMVSSAFDAAKNFAKGLWDGFKHGLGINSPSLIEKQMVQITQVTDAETTKLGNQVRTLQSLAGRITTSNPAKASASLNTSIITGLTKSMIQQAQLMHTASKAIFPGGLAPGSTSGSSASSSASSTSATGSGGAMVQKVVNVTVHNPIAERASDTAARKIRTLSAMGAF
jgi:hypothetical protein